MRRSTTRSFPYMSARVLDVALCAGARAARHVPGRARLRVARADRIRAATVRASVGRRRAPRHRQRRLSGHQQPAPREALSRLGLRYHAATTIRYEAGLGFCVAAGQGRVPRARRTRGRQGARSAAQARVVHRAAGAESVRRRDRAGWRPRAGPRHQRQATATRSAATSSARTSPPTSLSRADVRASR